MLPTMQTVDLVPKTQLPLCERFLLHHRKIRSAFLKHRHTFVIALFKTALTDASIIILTIVTGMTTARVLAPQGRGELAAMILWPQFFSFCSILGTPAALV